MNVGVVEKELAVKSTQPNTKVTKERVGAFPPLQAANRPFSERAEAAFRSSTDHISAIAGCSPSPYRPFSAIFSCRPELAAV